MISFPVRPVSEEVTTASRLDLFFSGADGIGVATMIRSIELISIERTRLCRRPVLKTRVEQEVFHAIDNGQGFQNISASRFITAKGRFKPGCCESHSRARSFLISLLPDQNGFDSRPSTECRCTHGNTRTARFHRNF